ncbi:MAG: sigma 54-interacting transcriptional regulator [Opitutales bacterium]
MIQLFSPDERHTAENLSRLLACNPFTPTRRELERAILGDSYEKSVPSKVGVHRRRMFSPNLAKLGIASKLAEKMRLSILERREKGKLSARDFTLYRDLVFLTIFDEVRGAFVEKIDQAHIRDGDHENHGSLYRSFAERFAWFFPEKERLAPADFSAAHLFAVFFQVRRAFFHVFDSIVGNSPALEALRARVWESIFTHDMLRYQRSLYGRMGDITTLISGPSGTGKELVARAIGLSRFIPFEEKKGTFASDFLSGFHPINLSALSETLLESELFGHAKGAFTGALQDRKGYFETCGPHGSVLLDEITETKPEAQVKLLRVLQTRRFQRLGDVQPIRFEGKVMAATNRDLAEEMQAGRFREDFYYRLCANRIRTPSLDAVLKDSPGELEHLVGFVAARVAGPDEAPALTDETCSWITRKLSPDYSWPGNFRELQQCVRNILIHREYLPDEVGVGRNQSLAEDIANGKLPMEELQRRYVTQIYARTGKYEETARRLGIDRRTVKKYLDEELLAELRET